MIEQGNGMCMRQVCVCVCMFMCLWLHVFSPTYYSQQCPFVESTLKADLGRLQREARIKHLATQGRHSALFSQPTASYELNILFETDPKKTHILSDSGSLLRNRITPLRGEYNQSHIPFKLWSGSSDAWAITSVTAFSLMVTAGLPSH